MILRNKPIACLNFVSALALIIITNGETTRYLLTDTIAYLYVMLAFVQIACAVIFGWIYPKGSVTSSVVMSSTDATPGVQTHKMVMTLNVIFLLFIVFGIYNAIIVYVRADYLFSLPYVFAKDLFPLLFLSAATYLFIRKMQIGWILGAAYFICILVSSLVSRITTLVILLKNPNIKAIGVSPIFNTVNLAMYVICLFLIFSRPVKETFAIKRNQIILASVAGTLLSFILGYVASFIIDVAIRAGAMPL